MPSRTYALVTSLMLIGSGGATSMPNALLAQALRIDPATLPRIGTIDERYQSYNVEMVEVTGGRFWRPYGKGSDAAIKAQNAPPGGNTPAGMSPDLYQQREPIDLTNPKLRKLAAALAPAYVRVSGTWANTTYFQDSNASTPVPPPKGYNGVLTRQEWKGVIDFAKAVDAKIVTSVAISPGTRNAYGVWTPAEAETWFNYTKSIGGSIAATEYMNEPTYAAMGGAPKGYNAADYGRDVKIFKPFIKREFPHIIFLGPGSVGEGGALDIQLGSAGMLRTQDLLKAAGDIFDAFSYHYYGAASERCAGMGAATQTSAELALTQKWLTQTDTVEAYYAGLRDQYEPGKPMWITETADAACGGNPWAPTFTDSFRYLYQLGSLATRGVKVIMHNTLASSDYGLLDQTTLNPRPNYWAALLWRRLMGATVLDAHVAQKPKFYVFAQCLRHKPGGVALLILNTDHAKSRELNVPVDSQRYTLTATSLMDTTIQLNGIPLTLDARGDLPQLAGIQMRAGKIVSPAQSITFLAIPEAKNSSCH